MKLFGFTLGKKEVVQNQPPTQPAFTLPTEAIDDGAVNITSSSHFGTYVDLEGSVRNELELITRYREMANHPELDMAVDEIVNEAISHDDTGKIIHIKLDNLKLSETIKKKIIEEFNNIQKMLNFSNISDDLFRRWYIDGRLFFHIIVDEKNPKNGIVELRYIDPRKIRKVREIKQEKDPKTGAVVIASTAEYYVYNDRGTTTQTYTSNVNTGVKIAPDSILNINSGLMDAKNTFVISYLHSAIKPLNQLRMIEDAVVIYRISRASERRIFYIDVGNLPKGKAEQYMQDIMVKYRNKMVYNQQSGELVDQRKHLSMLEDFFLPRREGSKGTEITTLPSGQNLSQIEDVVFFRQKLLQALKVPISRLDPQQGGLIGLGRTSEVTRDEVKFSKFIDRLRNKFSQLFDNALSIQLALKGICTREEWETFKDDVYYDYVKDNNFTEMRDADLMRERVNLLTLMEPYIGTFYSKSWIDRNVLRFSEEEIEQMKKEIENDDYTPQNQQNSEQLMQQPAPEDLEDNTQDTEDLTPQLSADVSKYSKSINK